MNFQLHDADILISSFTNILESLKLKFLDTAKSAAKQTASMATDIITSGITSLYSLLAPFSNSALLIMHLIRFLESLMELLSKFLNASFIISTQGITQFFGISFYTKLVSFILNSYELLKSFLLTFNIKLKPIAMPGVAQAGSAETFCAALFLSSVLPPQLLSIVRNFTSFTHLKILDDSSWIYEIISTILQLPCSIASLLIPDSLSCKESILNFLNYFNLTCPFSEFSIIQNKFITLHTQYAKEPRLAGEPSFQIEFDNLYAKYIPLKERILQCKKELPSYSINTDKQITQLKTKIFYTQNNTRQEPVCIVFAGGAGTGKTTCMNKLVKAFAINNSVYVHAVADEKDFYDCYDNEDVFVTDDTGQKGTYQWANFINMISSTKFPLNCAAAHLKNTKTFTSKLMLTTTNEINPTLTPDCGISNIHALHRRLVLIDFVNMKFPNGVCTGDLLWKEFNLSTNRYDLIHTIPLLNGDIDYAFIVTEIFKLIAKKKQEYILNTTAATNIIVPAIPQAGNTIFQLFKSNYDLYFKPLINYAFDFFTISNIKSFFSESNFKIGCCIAVSLGAIVSLSYLFFSYQIVDLSEKTKQNIIKTYHSGKVTKTKLLHAVPQSISDIFSINAPFVNILPLERIKNQTKAAEATYLLGSKQITTTFTITMAGQYFTAPYHGLSLDVNSTAYVTIYSAKDSRYYDNVLCKCVYQNKLDDVVIMELPQSLPKYLKNINFCHDTSNTTLVLSTPSGLIKLNKLQQLDCHIRYKSVYTDYTNDLKPLPNDCPAMIYDFNQEALCGAMLITEDGFLVGHHVAKIMYPSPTDSSTSMPMGVTRIFSKETRDAIRKFFSTNIHYSVTPTSDQPIGSVVSITNPKQLFAPTFTKSTIVPSQVYSIFPVLRAPANLGVYGSKTAAIMDGASHHPTATVDLKALKFVEDYLHNLIPISKIHLLTDYENVKGYDQIGPVDKTTSVGFGLTLSKTDYIDFDAGTLKSNIKTDMNVFENSVLDGSYSFNDLFSIQLKDELKNLAKIDKPRTFKMSPLVITLLYRKYFGSFLNTLRLNRRKTGIQVGINPLGPDWNDLYKDTVSIGDNVFDGDYVGWDKKMLPQMQQLISRLILSKSGYKSTDLIPSMLLQLMCTTPSIVGNKLTITTHSLPSGLVGTAEFNSLVNKAYSAYVFYTTCVLNNITPSISEYMLNVVDNVYGDDKLTSVTDKYKHIFNGPAYQQVMQTIGLDFTPADKGEWTYKTRSIQLCSFLKRGFEYHTKLSTIVAPLEQLSMTSTLNFVKDDFRNHELTRVKLLNFQREAFLHSDYSLLMDHVESFLNFYSINLTFLTEDYLISIYNTPTYSEHLQLT